jgi:arylsulfatase A-like enzyme
MPKNVVLLTLDTLRRDMVGCYGAEQSLTPFIDSLQDKCIRFTNCQATGPYTHASFPGILTSSYSLEYDDHGRADKLDPRRTLISEAIKKAALTTAAFHSNPEMCTYFGWNRGWDVYYDSMDEKVTPQMPYIKGGRINRKVEGWLSAHVASGDYRPFFLWTHYMDIHEPYIPEKRYVDLIDPGVTLSDEEMFALFTDVVRERDVSDSQAVELLRKLYCAHVREVDDYVKDFFGVLDSRGVLSDSVVIIAADHGEEFNEHGSLSHDGKMYRELIDVPLLIYDSARAGEEICETVVSNMDISPTILHLLGVDPCDDFQGRSVLPLDQYGEGKCFGEAIAKRGRQQPGDPEVYYHRKDNLKVIYNASDETWELYDLPVDPGEMENIFDNSPAAREMKGALQSRIDRNRS